MNMTHNLELGLWKPVTLGAQQFLEKRDHRMLIGGEWVDAHSGARL